MHKRFPLWLAIFALGAFVSLRGQPAAPAQTAAPQTNVIQAQIVATKVTGTVTKKIDGQVSPLANNDLVPQNATVNTVGDASVVLVFSNGATTSLGHDSELVIEQFLQDPFSAAVNVAALDAEPTVSKTKIRLNRGELVGSVKKLNKGSGSEFNVETPVGAAGIRGTVFRIVFRPIGNGRFSFQLTTVEGNVGFTPPAQNSQPSGGQPGQGGQTQGQQTDPNQPQNQNQQQGQGQQQGQSQGTSGTGGTQTGGTQTGAGTQGGTGGTQTGAGGAPSLGGSTGGIMGSLTSVGAGSEIVVFVNATTTSTGQVIVTTPPTVIAPPQVISAATQVQVTQVAQTLAVAAQTANFTAGTGTVTLAVTNNPIAQSSGNSGSSGSSGSNSGSSNSGSSGSGSSGSSGNSSGSSSGNSASSSGNSGSGSGSSGSSSGSSGSGSSGSTGSTGTTGSTGSTGSTGGTGTTGGTTNFNSNTTPPNPSPGATTPTVRVTTGDGRSG